MTPNARAAIIQYLLEQSDVTDLAGTRIFAEIPSTEVKSILLPTVTVEESGASDFGYSYNKWHTPRLEIWAYASSPSEASRLFAVVRRTLKQMRRNVKASTLLHSASSITGAVSGRDPATSWCFVWGSFDIAIAEDF